MKIIKFFILLFIVSLLSQPAYSDVIHLKNGAIYEGDIIKETSDKITIKLKIGALTIDKKLINSIHKDKKEVVDSLSKDRNILEELKQKSMQINSYKCETETNLYDNSIIKGTLVFKMPDKMKANYVVVSDNTDIRNLEVVVISDGDVFWMYYPQLNVAYKQITSELNNIVPGNEELSPGTFIEKLIQSDYRILGEDIVNSDKTYCVESTALEGNVGIGNISGQRPLSKCKLWLRSSDGFLVKSIGFSDKNEMIFSSQSKNIKTNIEIANEQFKFEVPEDVEIIDSSFLKTAEDIIKQKGF